MCRYTQQFENFSLMRLFVTYLSRLSVSKVFRNSLSIFTIALIIRGITAMPGMNLQEFGGAYTADSPRYERLGLTLATEGVYEAHQRFGAGVTVRFKDSRGEADFLD